MGSPIITNPNPTDTNRSLRMTTFRFDPDDAFNGSAGDNLFDPEDDHDETECLNWINHPVRGLFDNHKQLSHPSYEETTRTGVTN